jgi:hypothetical protein
MIESRSVKLALDAKQKMTGLNVVAGLNATNELGDAGIKVVAWNVQAAVRPGTAEVHARIQA